MSRLGGLWRELRPDRNPLRRACDRAEAVLLAVLLTAFLIGVPLAAVVAGEWQYSTALRVERAQAAWHLVSAVLLATAPAPGYAGYEAAVPATWAVPGGARRTGAIAAPAGTPAGAAVTLWVDASGRPRGTPLRGGQVVGQAIVTAVIAVAAVGLSLLCIAALARWVLARRRLAAWDAEWRVIGPQWTSRH